MITLKLWLMAHNVGCRVKTEDARRYYSTLALRSGRNLCRKRHNTFVMR